MLWPDEFIDKIINGDCLKVMQEIPDKSIDLIFTDLPYGVLNSRSEWDQIIPLDQLWTAYERIIKDNGAIVLTASQPFTSKLVMSNLKLFKYEIIWEKQQGTGFLNAKKQVLRSHESILVFYKKQPTYNPQFTAGKPYKCQSGRASLDYGEQKSVLTVNEGTRYPLSVQKFSYDKEKLHSTQKPQALAQWIIKTFTNDADIVLDSTTGSGSFPLAAKILNRKFIGIELNKEFYDIAVKRLNEYPSLSNSTAS
jgi:site-specific DNA-methyltransferase (adenine-specific)